MEQDGQRFMTTGICSCILDCIFFINTRQEKVLKSHDFKAFFTAFESETWDAELRQNPKCAQKCAQLF